MRSKVIAFAALPLLVALAALSSACIPGANNHRANFDATGKSSSASFRNNTNVSGWIGTEAVGVTDAPFWQVTFQDSFSTGNWHGRPSGTVIMGGQAVGNSPDGKPVFFHGGVYPGESFSSLFQSTNRGALSNGGFMDYQMAIYDGSLTVVQAL